MGVGCIKVFEHKIRLHPDMEPVTSRIHRRYPKELQLEKGTMTELLKVGIVTHSESTRATNNVLVHEEHGSLRCTTEFWALNSRKISDQYPMEGVRETLERLASNLLAPS